MQSRVKFRIKSTFKQPLSRLLIVLKFILTCYHCMHVCSRSAPFADHKQERKYRRKAEVKNTSRPQEALRERLSRVIEHRPRFIISILGKRINLFSVLTDTVEHAAQCGQCKLVIIYIADLLHNNILVLLRKYVMTSGRSTNACAEYAVL